MNTAQVIAYLKMAKEIWSKVKEYYKAWRGKKNEQNKNTGKDT